MLVILALVAAACAGGRTGGVTPTATSLSLPGAATATGDPTAAAIQDLPEAVKAKRAAILEAAQARDQEALAALAAENFSYSFGVPVEGGPAAYWRRAEESGEDPLGTLVTILQLPSTQTGVGGETLYVWPFAYDRDISKLTPEEREQLLGFATEDELKSWEAFGGYVGYRAGITQDGVWISFVAGD
jgi:hypothetical protein